MEDLAPRLEEGWAEPSRVFDDGHRLVGHRIYVAGLGSGIVRGFTKGKFGASAHTVELDVIDGISRGSVLLCVKEASARLGAEIDSELYPKKLAVGEELDVKEVRRLEGGAVRVRVFLRPTGSRKRTRCVWVSLKESDDTVLFVDRKQKRLQAAGESLPEAQPVPEPEPELESQPRPEPVPAPTKLVKLRRKDNKETPWLVWPRGKLPDDEATATIDLRRTATAPWEEQVELLQSQGWRLPTRKESLMDSELVNYNIYVSGYGPGRVLKFHPSSLGPSEHQVLFDDERFKRVRVKLRRKGNQETPWMVMPGLLHRRPGAGGCAWEDDDDDDDEDWGQEEERHCGQTDEVMSVAQDQLIPVEEGPETPRNDIAVTPCTPVTPLPQLSEDEEAKLVRVQGLVRGKSVRTKLTKSQQKRRQVALELLMTEDTYVKGLRSVVIAYVRPLQDLVGTKSEVLTTSQIRTLFSEIETILLMHETELLPQLKRKIADDQWSHQQTIGDLFGKTFASLLKMYTFYANNYMQALTLYGELTRECEAFVKFARGVQAEGAMTRSVESYLITPIQRIPRYVMLLHELKKATLPAHPDTPLLSLAVESIEEVANHVNEQKRDAENRAQVAVISRRLISSTMVRKELQLPVDFELVQPDRQLIKEGNLDDVRGTWMVSGGGELKKRTYFLFNDLFIKGHLAESADAPCAYRGMIKIDHTSIICRGRAWMNQKWYPAFSLRGRGEGDGNEWVMLAESNEAREEWVAALNRCRNWKHSFAVDYAKKLVLEQAAKDREETERAKTNKRAARRASLEPSLNPYSLDRFDQFLAAQASTALAPLGQSERSDQSNTAGGRLRQSTDAALADIDQALAASLSMIGSDSPMRGDLEGETEQLESEEEDEMPSATVVHGDGAGIAVHFAPGPAPSTDTNAGAKTHRSRLGTASAIGSPGRRASLPDMTSVGSRAQSSVALVSSLPQTSSPAIGSPQSFASADSESVNISATTSELVGDAADNGENVDYRRVLGEGSEIEVELIVVDPDDLEGPLGVEGRSGVSGTNTPATLGFSTPQSARSSFARTSIATASSRGRRGPLGRYRVLHQCKYRAGVSMDSEELGYLTEGWVIKVWDKQMTEEGQTRMRFSRSKEGVKARGWVSLKAKNGKRLLMAEG